MRDAFRGLCELCEESPQEYELVAPVPSRMMSFDRSHISAISNKKSCRCPPTTRDCTVVYILYVTSTTSHSAARMQHAITSRTLKWTRSKYAPFQNVCYTAESVNCKLLPPCSTQIMHSPHGKKNLIYRRSTNELGSHHVFTAFPKRTAPAQTVIQTTAASLCHYHAYRFCVPTFGQHIAHSCYTAATQE